MFDIGLPELFLVLSVGLLVLGPERLPEIIKTTTKSFNWFKRTANATKDELSKNIGLEEIYQDIHNEEVLRKTKKDETEE